MIFTPPYSVEYRIEAIAQSGDPILRVYRYGSQVQYNDDYSGLSSRIDMWMETGTEYLIEVAGYRGGSGHFEIRVDG